MFTGGVVQVIDSLLIPPSNLTSTTQAFNYTSFEGAVYEANKVDTYSNAPNVTIFVPTNEAFQALGPAISTMTSDELAHVLDYTFLPSLIYSTSLINGTKFATLNGANLTVFRSGNNVYINSAQLLTSDILIANGVMHVIDNVLNPAGPGAQPNPQIATQAPVFASATLVQDLPFTSALPCTVSCPVSSTSGANSSGASSAQTTSRGASVKATNSVSTHSSMAQAAAVARETGFGASGLIVALGGAVLMI